MERVLIKLFFYLWIIKRIQSSGKIGSGIGDLVFISLEIADS